MPHEPAQLPEVTALAALRSATSSLHAALDSGLPLSRDGAGLADYVDHLRHLRRWLASYLDAERSLGSAVDAGSVGRKQALLARVDRDLADAGSPVEQAGHRSENLPEAVAERLHDAAYRWGVDYVIEGSQLGGSVLYRRFADRLAPHPLAYLKGDGPDTGARWRVFMATLNAAVTAPEQIAAACAGAVDAFHRLMSSFGMAGEEGRQTRGRAA